MPASRVIGLLLLCTGKILLPKILSPKSFLVERASAVPKLIIPQKLSDAAPSLNLYFLSFTC